MLSGGNGRPAITAQCFFSLVPYITTNSGLKWRILSRMMEIRSSRKQSRSLGTLSFARPGQTTRSCTYLRSKFPNGLADNSAKCRSASTFRGMTSEAVRALAKLTEVVSSRCHLFSTMSAWNSRQSFSSPPPSGTFESGSDPRGGTNQQSAPTSPRIVARS